MNRKNRINDAFNYLRGSGKVKTQTDVAERMRASRSNVSAAFNGDEKFLTDNFIRRFNKAFDGLFNDEWLLFGTGSMLTESQIQIDTTESEIGTLPLVPISAIGGTLNDFIVTIGETECERIVSPVKNVDFALTVSGDSMAPEYPSGCTVLVKRINERAFIDWGRVYVLDTCNGTVIKKIMPGSTSECVSCLSLNTNYPPFEVMFSDIYGMYRVLLMMAGK